MHRQKIFIASIGMTAGLAAGSLVAFFLIPTVVKALGDIQYFITFGKWERPLLWTFADGGDDRKTNSALNAQTKDFYCIDWDDSRTCSWKSCGIFPDPDCGEGIGNTGGSY